MRTITVVYFALGAVLSAAFGFALAQEPTQGPLDPYSQEARTQFLKYGLDPADGKRTAELMDRARSACRTVDNVVVRESCVAKTINALVGVESPTARSDLHMIHIEQLLALQLSASQEIIAILKGAPLPPSSTSIPEPGSQPGTH